jgi:histone-lysine N-methyltransferase SETD3
MTSFKIEAYGDCVANAELFDSYGKKCNSRFLLNYGFIEEDNDANEYMFTINFDESYPLYEEKIEYTPQLETNVLKFKISKDFESSNFEEFMSFIRFCMIDDVNELNFLFVSNTTTLTVLTPSRAHWNSKACKPTSCSTSVP